MIKVLIAEDDSPTRKLLGRWLQAWGYDPICAVNGMDAWREIQKGMIQIAILDWIMPKMDGAALCRKIREESSSRYIYVILLSVKDQQQDIRKGFQAGADDYITKPFDSDELKARLGTGKRIIDLQARLLESKEILEKLATHDTLTHLFNRNEILDLLYEECARSEREGRPLSTIMLDVDRFKEINDDYGHQVGDEVLIEVASRMKRVLRKYDRIGRYGGDEFLVICPSCGLKNAERIAERLRRAVGSTKILSESGPIHVTISLGCASSENQRHPSKDYLVKTSDRAMYHSKNTGRDCVTPL